MEAGLEFMSVIGANFPDTEREPVDDVIDEVYGIGLGMPVVDLESANAGRIVDGGVLEAADLAAIFSIESQNLTSIWM